MSRDQITKKFSDGEVVGFRRPGRPRTRWKDCVNDDLRALGMTVVVVRRDNSHPQGRRWRIANGLQIWRLAANNQ